jgi:hypothetical protein
MLTCTRKGRPNFTKMEHFYYFDLLENELTSALDAW